MSSTSDQRRHKADTGGPSNTRDRILRLFNDVLVERTRCQDGRSVVTHRGEVTGSFTSGRTVARSDRGSPLRSQPQGIVAGVRRLYLEARGWMILPWLFSRSCK
ncbi:hypothetical protein ACOSQ2_007254 [Xanthoceras sorbifolium]